MTTFINRTAPVQTSHYRNAQYTQQQQQQPKPDIRDDYERWYTEPIFNNRMTLSVRSTIHSEISWALDRLCRLTHNEQFLFTSIPGVIDSLFDWPEWYVTEGYKSLADEHLLFSVDQKEVRQRRFALESLFVLRNAALHDSNARELAVHSHTFPLIMNGVKNLDPSKDENTEALAHIIDLFHILVPTLQLTAPYFFHFNPIPYIARISGQTQNRSMIITCLTALSTSFANPPNAVFLRADSEALTAAIRYLPLFVDKPLVDACVNYLYAHISVAALSRAFLLHPDMPGTIKVLASLLVHEQRTLQEKVTVDVSGPIQTAPSPFSSSVDHILTKEELDSLVDRPEPERCYEWMRTMFVARVDGEMTQVDFWNLYKDTFNPFADRYVPLAASDVIKNVTNVFPTAQAMVLQGSTPRFIVRGVDRRKDVITADPFRCFWHRGTCDAQPFASSSELHEHVLGHLSELENPEDPCQWSTCPQTSLPNARLKNHVLTHIAGPIPAEKHPSQSDTITLPTEPYPHPSATPTQRPPPPPRKTLVTYERPVADPSSTGLTALLILRLLFRTSITTSETAVRHDEDHFGFPGIVEDALDPSEIVDANQKLKDREGERRGRRAFNNIRRLLEDIQLKDATLMSWITEMLDAGIEEGHSSE